MAFSKSRSVSLWVTRVDYWFSVSTGGFLLPRILSVLIRLPLSAESWPSDIISPHSPLIKGRNDKSWQCSDRNLPRWVLFMHASLTARRPACSGMVTPPPQAQDLQQRCSWECGGHHIKNETWPGGRTHRRQTRFSRFPDKEKKEQNISQYNFTKLFYKSIISENQISANACHSTE